MIRRVGGQSDQWIDPPALRLAEGCRPSRSAGSLESNHRAVCRRGLEPAFRRQRGVAESHTERGSPSVRSVQPVHRVRPGGAGESSVQAQPQRRGGGRGIVDASAARRQAESGYQVRRVAAFAAVFLGKTEHRYHAWPGDGKRQRPTAPRRRSAVRWIFRAGDGGRFLRGRTSSTQPIFCAGNPSIWARLTYASGRNRCRSAKSRYQFLCPRDRAPGRQAESLADRAQGRRAAPDAMAPAAPASTKRPTAKPASRLLHRAKPCYRSRSARLPCRAAMFVFGQFHQAQLHSQPAAGRRQHYRAFVRARAPRRRWSCVATTTTWRRSRSRRNQPAVRC